MKKRVIIRIIKTTLKALVTLAAAINLIALFVFHYEMPQWLRKGGQESTAGLIEDTVVPENAIILSPIKDPNTEVVHLAIPVVPVSYSGEADLDAIVLDGVYVQGSDDQPIEDAQIRYEILPGESHQKKIIQYIAELTSGETLTETRVMNLTARYTGPTITLLSPLPELDPDDADVYAERLGTKGVIRADDGFGNDATELVSAVFDDLSDEHPDANLTLVLENQVHDTYELELIVQVEGYTGVVLTLTDHRITLSEGDVFEPRDYISYAHDAEGNDLTDRVTVDSDVDTGSPGNYEVWYWAEDSAGTYSPTKKLFVTVEPAQEEEPEAEGTP